VTSEASGNLKTRLLSVNPPFEIASFGGPQFASKLTAAMGVREIQKMEKSSKPALPDLSSTRPSVALCEFKKIWMSVQSVNYV
jgi:hypothetical protein